MSKNIAELRSLASTPTWSVATVLTIFVAVSLLVERSIHWLVWIPFMLHKEPLSRLYTSLCNCGFLCSYSTLPLNALVTQVFGGNKLQSSLDSKKNKRQSMDREGKPGEGEGEGMAISLMIPLCTWTRAQSHLSEEDDNNLPDSPIFAPEKGAEIELQPHAVISIDLPVADQSSNQIGTPFFRPMASVSSPFSLRILPEMIPRSSSMPR